MLNLLMQLMCLQFAVGEQLDVGWVEVRKIKLLQFFVIHFYDFTWMTTQTLAIRVVFEKKLQKLLVEEHIWVLIISLHFVVDYAFELQLAVFNLPPPALLQEVESVEIGPEDDVEIHVEQVLIIFVVDSGERESNEIAPSPRIHICVQASLVKIHEWILNWVLFSAAAHQMFKNMGDSFVILVNHFRY